MKEEIISEIKNDLKVSITAQVQTEFVTKIEKQYKDFDFKTKELADGFNLDFDTLREKLHAQARDIRYLQDKLKDCQLHPNLLCRLQIRINNILKRITLSL